MQTLIARNPQNKNIVLKLIHQNGVTQTVFAEGEMNQLIERISGRGFMEWTKQNNVPVRTVTEINSELFLARFAEYLKKFKLLIDLK